MKKLEKFARNLEDDSDFTMMSNREFEVLFHAKDRDDEVGFRVLFTALAQQQMVKLLNDGESGYGDDFAYIKQGTITRIVSEHLNNTSLSEPPFHSGHFDLQEIRKTFLESSAEFFRSIYFALEIENAENFAIVELCTTAESCHRFQSLALSALIIFIHINAVREA